ncbi:DUF4255 domain-containing protein [Paracoccus liaowanqingii]|uniref:DUF4255 domain-containing protein n=2 Tax=Paracoccus liaowanqingii TaxID=2560053 RepID=A0A4P7HN95_9RHOB|nr:DUF4255 domain-containing protein [Paracoccus liaowanqingii]
MVMAGSGVISDVSLTLINVLDTALGSLFPAPAPQVILHDLQGVISTNPATLAVLLYEVTEDASTRNRPMQRAVTAGGRVLRKPLMTLILRYMIVPYAGDRLTEQQMLGRAMQTIYDNSIFSGPDLRGAAAPAGLVGSSDTLAATLDPLSLEERTRVWHAIQKPYRLSICYQIRVANVEPTIDVPTDLVRSRNFDQAVPVGE